MLEKWKTIDEPEIIKDAYLISNYGRIKMRTREYYAGRPLIKRVIKGRFMKPSLTAQKYNSQGYYSQPLRKVNGGQKTFFIHRLVAKYFLPDWDETLTVNHKDENQLNNKVTNLEMVTMKYNNNYGTRYQRALEKRIANPDKRNIKPVILSKGSKEIEIRSITACAEFLGVGKAKVRSCLRGQREEVHGWKIREK